MMKRKIFLHVAVLGLLLTSLALAFGLFSSGTKPGYAQSSVTTTEYYLNSGQEPWGVTFDNAGHVWVAVPGCDPNPTCSSSTPPGKIEEFNASSSSWMATYQLPSGFGQALFLAFDAQGNLWFPMPMSNSIGKLNPSNQSFQQFPVPTANAGPWGIAIDHNGNIWFTEHFTNKIGKFNPSTQSMQEFTTPSGNSQPYGITVDGSNNIWFTENNSAVARIGEYTSGGSMKEYTIRSNPPSSLTPHLITVDPNGNIWWTEGWVGMIAELKVSQAVPGTNNGVTEHAYTPPCSSCGTHTSGISVDHNGMVWFDDALQGMIGSFPDSGNGSFSLYTTPTQSPHTHDGLAVDGQNRIWFTEEFANKLGKAVQNGVPQPTPSPSPQVTPSPTHTPTPTPTPTHTPTPTPTPTNTPTPTPSPSPSPSPSPTVSPTPGATLASDTFQRANQQYWGTASDGQTWGGDANSLSYFSIANKTGQIANGTTSYNAVLGPTATNAEVIMSSSISSFSNTSIGAVLRWQDSRDWYKAYISGSSFVILKDVNAVSTSLARIAFTATPGTSYTIDFEVVGTTLSANVWQTGTPEPSGWMITGTDSTFSSGYCGMRIQVLSGDVATVTSFEALYQ